MVEAIDAARASGDTLGGVFTVIAEGVPPGLGSFRQWDTRLDGALAQAVMSIPACKGVAIGDGMLVARLRGSQSQDEPFFRPSSGYGHRTNHAGGLEGGMTNGEPVVIHGMMKPISTLLSPLPTVDVRTGVSTRAHYERSDVCVVPAAGVIGEAMVSLTLAGAFLEKFGGDSMAEVARNLRGYLRQVRR
jgi:chorismate synthase